jgi:hypothetical protein
MKTFSSSSEMMGKPSASLRFIAVFKFDVKLSSLPPFQTLMTLENG